MRERTKMSKQYIYLALICFILFVVLLYMYTFYPMLNYLPSRSYFEYFLNYRLPDFTNQLTLIIMSITFFVKSRNLADRARITIVTSVWCFIGAFASLAWSFEVYFRYPIPSSMTPLDRWNMYRIPGVLSSLILFGTSIFLFIARNYTEKKTLRPKFVKKVRLVDLKIDSDTRKNIMEKVSTSNLKDLINSLTCLKCGSIAILSFYTVREKTSSRDTNYNFNSFDILVFDSSRRVHDDWYFINKKPKRDTNYNFNSFDIPVCDSCRRLYDDWYSIYKKPNSHVLRTIFNIFFVLLFLPMIFFNIFFMLLPLVGVIYFIVSIGRRRLAFSAQNSPYNNVKFTMGYKVRVRPDNFKKWTSLQDWVLYNLMTEESRKPQLSETEITLLNYLNEYKGSAFSPRALVKRAIGENFTEEYVDVINKLLKKMDEKGIINSNYNDGKPYYFSS